MLSVMETVLWPTPPAQFNLADHVLSRSDALADKIALAIVGPARAERWSFGRLKAAVLGTGTGLLREGVAPGDRVLLRLGNTSAFPVAFLACVAIGAIPVPMSAALTAREIAAILDLISPLTCPPEVPSL